MFQEAAVLSKDMDGLIAGPSNKIIRRTTKPHHGNTVCAGLTNVDPFLTENNKASGCKRPFTLPKN